MVYSDPISGKHVARSTGVANSGPKSRAEAERPAAIWEEQLNSGRYKPPSKLTWAEFRERYETEGLAGKSESMAGVTRTAMNHLERLLNPDRLSKLTSEAMSRFASQLRKEKIKETTLAGYLVHLMVALRWAVKIGLLPEAPSVEIPRATGAKGRPITAEEFDRMLAAVPKVRPHDPGVWTRYLYGLWLSGLRLEESTILSWDVDAPFAVDLSGKHPAFRIEAKAQKARRSEVVPMTPDFAEWLLQTPEDERQGRVFRLLNLQGGQPITLDRVGGTITKFGKKAGIVVARDPDTGKVKYASAHDLRRSFGTRWAKRVMPAVLKRLMRHADIQTTMQYYVNLGADEVAADLWATHRKNDNTSDNSWPQKASGAGKKPAERGASGGPVSASNQPRGSIETGRGVQEGPSSLNGRQAESYVVNPEVSPRRQGGHGGEELFGNSYL